MYVCGKSLKIVSVLNVARILTEIAIIFWFQKALFHNCQRY